MLPDTTEGRRNAAAVETTGLFWEGVARRDADLADVCNRSAPKAIYSLTQATR
jgi:hypothetical protein